MNFSSVYFKIRGESDQISNMDLVALYSLYNFWVHRNLRIVQKYGGNRPMKMVQRRCARAFRVSSQSRRRAQFLAATWPTNTGEPFSPRAGLRAAYPRTGYSSNWSPSRCPLLESTRAASEPDLSSRRRLSCPRPIRIAFTSPTCRPARHHVSPHR